MLVGAALPIFRLDANVIDERLRQQVLDAVGEAFQWLDDGFLKLGAPGLEQIGASEDQEDRAALVQMVGEKRDGEHDLRLTETAVDKLKEAERIGRAGQVEGSCGDRHLLVGEAVLADEEADVFGSDGRGCRIVSW